MLARLPICHEAEFMTIRECYTVLELEPGATFAEVKRAWKLLATVWHPDRFNNNPKLRDQAEEKLKRINSAYDLLRKHFENGGSGNDDSGPSESEQAAESYVDSQCWYLNGDARIRSVSKLELSGRPAIIRLDANGLTIVTVVDSNIDEATSYPGETVRWLDVHGMTWSTDRVNFNPYKYEAPWHVQTDRAELHVLDPEGITDGFVVKVRFRNEYFRKLFEKRMRHWHCPVDVGVACKTELERAAAQRNEQLKREEAERQRQAEAKRKAGGGDVYSDSNRAAAMMVAGLIGFFSILSVSLLFLDEPNHADTAMQRRLETDELREQTMFPDTVDQTGEEVVSQTPSNSAGRDRVDSTLLLSTKPASSPIREDPEELVIEAWRALKQSNYLAVQVAADALEAEQPSTAFILRGWMYLELGKDQRAEDAFLRAMHGDKSLVLASLAAMEAARVSEGRPVLRRGPDEYLTFAVEAAPTEPVAYFLRSMWANHDHNPDANDGLNTSALKDLEEVRRLRPSLSDSDLSVLGETPFRQVWRLFDVLR